MNNDVFSNFKKYFMEKYSFTALRKIIIKGILINKRVYYKQKKVEIMVP
jgi:hypothetical protein